MFCLLLLENCMDIIKIILDKIDAKVVANASTLYFLLKNVFDTFNIHIKANVSCAYYANGFEKCLLLNSRLPLLKLVVF